jgi:hypothetical protein
LIEKTASLNVSSVITITTPPLFFLCDILEKTWSRLHEQTVQYKWNILVWVVHREVITSCISRYIQTCCWKRLTISASNIWLSRKIVHLNISMGGDFFSYGRYIDSSYSYKSTAFYNTDLSRAPLYWYVTAWEIRKKNTEKHMNGDAFRANGYGFQAAIYEWVWFSSCHIWMGMVFKLPYMNGYGFQAAIYEWVWFSSCHIW